MLVTSNSVVLYNIKGKVIDELVVIPTQPNITEHPSCNFIKISKCHLYSITGHLTKCKFKGKKRGPKSPKTTLITFLNLPHAIHVDRHFD